MKQKSGFFAVIVFIFLVINTISTFADNSIQSKEKKKIVSQHCPILILKSQPGSVIFGKIDSLDQNGVYYTSKQGLQSNYYSFQQISILLNQSGKVLIAPNGYSYWESQSPYDGMDVYESVYEKLNPSGSKSRKEIQNKSLIYELKLKSGEKLKGKLVAELYNGILFDQNRVSMFYDPKTKFYAMEDILLLTGPDGRYKIDNVAKPVITYTPPFQTIKAEILKRCPLLITKDNKNTVITGELTSQDENGLKFKSKSGSIPGYVKDYYYDNILLYLGPQGDILIDTLGTNYFKTKTIKQDSLIYLEIYPKFESCDPVTFQKALAQTGQSQNTINIPEKTAENTAYTGKLGLPGYQNTPVDNHTQFHPKKREMLHKFHVGLGYGYSRYLAEIPSNSTEIMDDYYDEIKGGTNINIEATMFITHEYGIGLRYSRFHSYGSINDIYIYDQDTMEVLAHGDISDDLTFTFAGAVFCAYQRLKEKFYFSGALGFGKLDYTDKGNIFGEHLTLESSTLGSYAEIAADYLLTRNMSIGGTIILIRGNFNDTSFENNTIDIEEETSGNHFNFNIGFRFYF